MDLRWGPRRLLVPGGGGADLISKLPDDLLLLILARLPCVSAAARTGVLSRRWRGLWARLRQIVFRDVPFRSLEPVLRRIPRPRPAISLLDIRSRVTTHRADAASSVKSLLRAAARLDPEEFVFELKTISSGVVDLRWRPRRRSPRLLVPGGGGPDLISALPDDLLLLILARLPCVRAAARTGVLSRRWRGLWAGLHQIVFRDVALPSLVAVLGRVPGPPPAVSLLDIRVPPSAAAASSVNSLLRAAARLDPEEFVFELITVRSGVVDLPCFHRATSIVLDLYNVIRCVPAGVEFPALETLSLWNCRTDVDRLLACCPRLRRLRLIDVYFDERELRVNSASLQELDVSHGKLTRYVDGVNIVAPVLKQLTMYFITSNVSISVCAPMVEKVSWRCFFRVSVVFGLWRIKEVTLQTSERQGQLPSLYIHAYCASNFKEEVDTFTQEMEKHMIAAFSVLELYLTTDGHVFGAFVFKLLGMNQIHCGMQKLKIDLHRPAVEVHHCPLDCHCDSSNWRSRTISLTALEEVEINSFEGAVHEFDFLKLILRSAPILKKMTVKLSEAASSSKDGCAKIYNILKTCWVNVRQQKLPRDMISVLTYVDPWCA